MHATKAKAQGPDEKVVRLTEMGFDAQAAQAALFSANGDEQVSETCGIGLGLTLKCSCRRLCLCIVAGVEQTSEAWCNASRCCRRHWRCCLGDDGMPAGRRSSFNAVHAADDEQAHTPNDMPGLWGMHSPATTRNPGLLHAYLPQTGTSSPAISVQLQSVLRRLDSCTLSMRRRYGKPHRRITRWGAVGSSGVVMCNCKKQ